VAAVVRDGGGRVLLHHRVVGGGWAPPSGAMEPGETLEHALHRELREETGLTVEVQRLVAVYSDPAFQIVTYPDGRRVHFVTALYACRVTGGALRGSEEGRAWAWFATDELPGDLLPYAAVWLEDALRSA
jgi:ADP-ribose pyrophosphatase YjhB (NUDIX family)